MQNNIHSLTVQFVNGYADLFPVEIKKRITALLEKSMYNDEADMCALHAYHKNDDELRVIAQAGLSPAYMEHFKYAHPFDNTASGRAFGIGNAIIVCDVNTDVSYKDNRQSANQEGVRAVKAMPLFWQQQKVGVIATHFREARYTWNLNHLDEVMRPLAEVLATATHFLH